MRTRARGSGTSSHAELVGSARTSAALLRRPGDAIAHLEPSPVAFARCELDDFPRTAERGRSPGPEVALDGDDDLIRVQEDDVDREVHEVRVDRERRAEHHALAGIESTPAQQPAETPVHAVRDDAALADDPSVFSAERQRAHEL